jgi:pimeloyl-ACP methyl ester carboxylesterase
MNNKRPPVCRIVLAALCACSVSGLRIAAQTVDPRPIAIKDGGPVPGQPYERFTTQDRFGREITFYLSRVPQTSRPLPLAVYIQGSGCASLFERKDAKVVPKLGHATLVDIARGKARVLIVEKPGVTFPEQPENCRLAAEFNREHTLERWAEAVEAAIRAARTLGQVSGERAAAIGHSEGGLVACRVARDLPGIVTHVASMAGGGPSQLFDLIELARRGVYFRDISEDAAARVQYVLSQWREIRADPTNAEKFFFGFSYRRWSTFLADSPMEELTKANAKIYLAQGLEDEAVNPESSDALYAQLLAVGKQAVYDRIEGAGHSFDFRATPQINGWHDELERIVAWFLHDE